MTCESQIQRVECIGVFVDTQEGLERCLAPGDIAADVDGVWPAPRDERLQRPEFTLEVDRHCINLAAELSVDCLLRAVHDDRQGVDGSSR